MQHQLLSQLNQVVLPAVGDSDGTSEATIDAKLELIKSTGEAKPERPDSVDAGSNDEDDEEEDEDDDECENEDESPSVKRRRQVSFSSGRY